MRRRGRISFYSPIARAVRGAAVGDVRRVALPGGEKEYEVVAIAYPGLSRGLSPRIALGLLPVQRLKAREKAAGSEKPSR